MRPTPKARGAGSLAAGSAGKMHEFSLVGAILETVNESAKQAGAQRVVSIDIVVGDLSQVVDEAMDFAFDALSVGTLSEGAELRIEHVHPRSRCMDCGAEFEHGLHTRRCPECDGPFTELLSGREMYIDHIEVDLP